MPNPSGRLPSNLPAALAPPCYVFSDAHLGFASRAVEDRAVAFLRYLRDHAGSVIINGDLFEFWFEWRSVIPRESFRVLAALAELVERDIPVLMIAGNHDCWGGDVLRQDVGLQYTFGPWTGDVAGWRTRVEHGDGLRPEADRRYRALRTVLRNPLAIRAFRWVHPDFAMRLATGSSHASRTYVARDEGRGLRDAAERTLQAHRDLELLIFGHSHVAAIERIAGSVYANCGAWLDAPTYLHVTPERVTLRRWSPGNSTEGVDLNAFDRAAEKPAP